MISFKLHQRVGYMAHLVSSGNILGKYVGILLGHSQEEVARDLDFGGVST